MRGEIFGKVLVVTMGVFLVGTQLVNLVNFLNGGAAPVMNIYEMGLWWAVFLMAAFVTQNLSVGKSVMREIARPAAATRRRRR